MSGLSFNTSHNEPQQIVIKTGDTVYSLAKSVGMSVDDFKKAYGLTGDTIWGGQVLTRTTSLHEIQMVSDISDAQIEIETKRQRYLITTEYPPHKLIKDENPAKLAEKYGVLEKSILQLNNLTEADAKKLQIGDVLKIPSAREAKNIKSLNDVATAMGVSVDFLKRLKAIEDGKDAYGRPYADNRFHNVTYTDAEGNETIGIGHLYKKGEKKNLSDKEVLMLFANDLLKMEENLWAVLGGKKNYDKLPAPLKEALLDMTFNKGTKILEESNGLIWALKNERYEGAICRMTNNKTLKGNPMSGLSKRRLFDMSVAVKMYTDKGLPIPQSVINAAQQLYNDGVKLLREECNNKYRESLGISKQQYFQNQLAGYNKDIKSYLSWINIASS